MFIKLLASIGAVWIIKDSYIFSKPRNYITSKSKYLQKLFSCSLCLGFWAGLFFCFVQQLPSPKLNSEYLYYSLSTSAFCWLFDSLLDLIQYSTACIKSKLQKDV